MLYAAERVRELANDPDIISPNVRTIPKEIPKEGIGVVEAPRGTLFHHYRSDERGRVTMANLIVATQNNAARMAMSVDKAAKGVIKDGKVDDGILNLIEMAFRAYDPCHGCATHTLPGQTPILVSIYDSNGQLVQEIRRD
jgi:F420-non-reducing hydrogenase large subunit